MKSFKAYSKQYDNNTSYYGNADYKTKEDFDAIPFEFKIGLLKLICDDIGNNLIDILYLLKHDIWHSEIKKICPKEFIESIISNV